MENNSPSHTNSSESSGGGIFILLILAVIAYFNVPDEAEHKAELKVMLKEKIAEDRLERESEFALADGSNPIVDALIASWIENGLEVKNYYIFSTSHLFFDGEYMFMGFGMFGFVIFPAKIVQNIRSFWTG